MPVIYIVPPAKTPPGVMAVTVGVALKPTSDAVPPGVVTNTLSFAPAGTTAVILVGLITLNEVAGVAPAQVWPKLTAVAPVKLVPVNVMAAPLGAEVGVKAVRVGAETLKVVT